MTVADLHRAFLLSVLGLPTNSTLSDADLLNQWYLAGGTLPGGGGGGSVAADAIFDAKGDLVAGTANNTAIKVPVGTDGQVLVADSGQANGVRWGNRSRIADEVHADSSVSNSTAETDLVTLNVPTTLAVGDLVRTSIWAEFINNSGGAVTYIFRAKMGASTPLASPAVSIGANANRIKARIQIDFIVESTSAQRWSAIFSSMRGSGADTWAQTALIPTVSPLVGYGTSAEDTTVAKTLKFSVQMGTASAAADFIVRAALLEVVKKAA